MLRDDCITRLLAMQCRSVVVDEHSNIQSSYHRIRLCWRSSKMYARDELVSDTVA